MLFEIKTKLNKCPFLLIVQLNKQHKYSRFLMSQALNTETNTSNSISRQPNGEEFPTHNYPLKFEIIKKCTTSKARLSQLTLPHASLQTPQFMPVGTQGALKGVLPEQIKELNCNLILGNTYHLGHRPVGNLNTFI